MVTTGLATATTASAADEGPTRLYIVQLADLPIAAYDGSVPGYAKTAPGKGQKVRVNSTAAQRYKGYLDRKQDKALSRIAGEELVYSYKVALNGFAARMSRADADVLRRSAGVTAVTRNRIQQMDTSRTPDFLRLGAPGGIWSQTGGVDGDAGAGTVVGIVDSGIWPESPSFAGSGKPPAEFKNDCQGGESFAKTLCNDKLVVAKYFNATFPSQDLLKGEYKSPRDGDGHGSHTASTAAGNHGVPVTEEGINFGTVSGMAPGAQIAAYKVCWNGDAGGCGNADSVAAINAAVADGVDVINFSISGSLANTFADPVENAFFNAAVAGVFVATSAGNSGPGASTVAHNSPWLTTVAAGSHDRDGVGSVTLGNGATYPGKSITPGVESSPLVNSTDAGLAGADADDVELCVPGTLDPAKVNGKIVTCARGVIGRTEKSFAVEQAGGVGMIMYNPSENSVNADLHFLPSIHVDHVDGPEIVAYADTAGATAELADGQIVVGDDVLAPDVASFSSRGPATASGGDLLKPDLMAPGVDVLAAVAPPSNFGRSYDFYSGTSMSSPHIAGIGALMSALHPDWSPAAMKSALMTTASQTRNDGSPIPGTPFGFGSGQVVPNSAADPGLVYDAGRDDWRGFARGAGQCTFCGGTEPAVRIDPSDLNYPSIAIGSLAGTQTVTRQVTNVSGGALTVDANVVEPAGTDVVVTPSSLTLAAGETKSFTVAITRTTAAFSEYTFGSLTWSGGDYDVRSPIAVRPVAVAAPAAVSGTGVTGSVAYNVTPGYSGTLNSRVDGLVAAVTNAATYADGNAGNFDTEDPESNLSDPAVKKFEFPVTSGTYARWSTFADASSSAEDDIDLYVYHRAAPADELELVGQSATGSSDETVSDAAPDAGTYVVFVHNWDSVEATNDITLFHWLLGGSDAGNATVTPASTPVTIATPTELTFAWGTPTPLAASTRYLGRVIYDDGTDDIGATVVSINTAAATP